MSKEYLVQFTPCEPYFFGNDKTFLSKNDEVSSKYYIKSEHIPMQTTILGALRYLCIEEKRSDFDYDKEKLAERIGKSGFAITNTEAATYGVIEKISPVFLVKGDDILVPAPFDHKNSGNTNYTPFCDSDTAYCSNGTKIKYFKDFDPKERLTSDYMNVKTGEIISADKIFTTSVRVGINRSNNSDGFFKKEFCHLENGYSFGVFVKFKDNFNPRTVEGSDSVFAGQHKSLFSVSYTENEGGLKKLESDIKERIGDEKAYVLGDTFINCKAQELYKLCSFAVTKTRDFRSYITYMKDGRQKVTKDSTLYKLITAGSVLYPTDRAEFEKMTKNYNAEKIGFNTIILKGDK